MKHSDARTPEEIAEEFEALHGRKLGGDSRPASCSPVECDTCHHWEWDDGKHGFMSGYCPIFDKITHKDDGAKCTAWEQIHLENDPDQ